jgi:hypothetical protein
MTGALTIALGAGVGTTAATGVTFAGGSGATTLVTGANNDTVTLGNGNNTVNTGAGNDTIVGGTGTNIYTPGAGNDTMSMNEMAAVLANRANPFVWNPRCSHQLRLGFGNNGVEFDVRALQSLPFHSGYWCVLGHANERR